MASAASKGISRKCLSVQAPATPQWLEVLALSREDLAVGLPYFSRTTVLLLKFH